MKVSIKTDVVSLLLALCVLLTVEHSNGGCNMANGIKASFVFLESADSSHKTEYGYDTDANGGRHVSVAKDGTTYVSVMYDNRNDGNYENLTASSFDNYGFVLVSDSGVTATLAVNASFKDDDGRLLRIQGNQTGSFTVKIEPSTEDVGTGVCGELTVHVYDQKTVPTLHMYIESGVTKSYSGFESTINPVIKPAVMELTAVTVHLNHDFQYGSSYGGNDNGSYDHFRDGGGAGPEMDALITCLNSINNNPKVCIMNKAMHALRLDESAEADQNVVIVKDPDGILAENMVGIIVGCGANEEEPNRIDEYRRLTGERVKVTFRNNLSHDHSTGYSDGVYKPGAVAFPNSGAISGANFGDQFVVHEVLHLTEFGALTDISPSASGVGDNVMKSTNMGFGKLRYRSLSGEIQWDKVHQ